MTGLAAVALVAAAGIAGPAGAATTGVAAAAATGVTPGEVSLDLGPGESATVATEVVAPEVAPQPDIVFLADTTGSTDPALANVRNNLGTIMEQVLAVQPEARFGVTEYKEERDGPRVFTVNTPLTSEQDAVVAGAQEWMYNVGGGGQPWTDFGNALYQIATGAVAFRPVGSRIVAWFGDARSHDPSLGHTLSDTVNALRAMGIRVVAVPVLGAGGDDLDALGQATTITSRTQGLLMPGQSSDQVAAALLTGIKALAVPVTPKVTACDPAISTQFDPAVRTVRSGTTANLTVKVADDAASGTYSCTVDYLVNNISQGYVQNITVTTGPDVTPPAITSSVAPANPDGANGWYVSAPTVTFSCSDRSGISSCSPPTTLGSSAVPQSVTGMATDTAGNTASTTRSGLKVDLVDPSLTCGPTPSFVAGESGQVTATVADAHSGPVTSSVTAAADTTAIGSHTVRLNGSDRAGRSTAVDCAYLVKRQPTALVAHPAKLGTQSLLKFTLTPRATLTRTDTRTALVGQSIRFTVGSRPVCTATTNASGVATCTGPVDLVSVLLSGYTATFSGSTTAEPATARARLG
jgi:hypothetical protein